MAMTRHPFQKQLALNAVLALALFSALKLLLIRFGLEYTAGHSTHSGRRGGYFLLGLRLPYWFEPVGMPTLFILILLLTSLAVFAIRRTRAA